MNLNDLLAILFLFVAITDTVLAQTILPKVFQKNPAAKPENIKLILMAVNATSIMFFVIAIIFYMVRPI